MKIRPIARTLAVAAFSASSLIAVAGCTTARKSLTPQTVSSEGTPKKEFEWKDLSRGQAFSRQQAKATPAY